MNVDFADVAKICSHVGGRLPTEAQWEYAARANQRNPRNLDEVAWHSDNSQATTHPVGAKKPNAWGLYDMLGNVREWTSDWCDDEELLDPSRATLGQSAGI